MSRHQGPLVPPVDLLPAAEIGDPPEGVTDRLLWRDARLVSTRHQEHPAAPGTCAWCWPGTTWPCGPRSLADRAARELAGPPSTRRELLPAAHRRPRPYPAGRVFPGGRP